MLSKDEQLRLASILGVLKVDRYKGVHWAREYTIETVEWLAYKLKEADVVIHHLVQLDHDDCKLAVELRLR